MKKTSLYLRDEDVERLKRVADREGLSQAEVLRAAIAVYEASAAPDRRFELFRSGRGDGRSVVDVPERELLAGFGED